MFNRGVVHIAVAGYIVDYYCLRFDRGVVCIVVAGYIVDHYCLMFDEKWFVLLWLFILLTITV
jgi:ABC-type iron transport system FetAB permease component